MWRSARRAIAALATRALEPAALRRLAELAPRERQLVGACDESDAAVVATHVALHRLEPPEGLGDWSRWGWEQIARIEWDDPTSTMTLIGQAPLLQHRIAFRLSAPGPLVSVARERIAWTTQLATRVRLPSGGSVAVVVRRHPVMDRMDWFLYPDTTIAGRGTVGRVELDDALASLRAHTGL